MPWSFELTVPSFDPRERLLADSSLTQLEAKLAGSGDLDTATLAGRVAINGKPLELERIHVVRATDGNVELDARIKPSQGALNAKGAVLLSQVPVAADLDLNWHDVVLPEAWVGQLLHTKGDLHVG